MRSYYGGLGLETSHERKVESFKNLPSNLGEYEVKLEARKLPTLKNTFSYNLRYYKLVNAFISCNQVYSSISRLAKG